MSASLNDLQMSWLSARGFTDPDINDRWMDFLSSLGFAGSIEDRWRQWLGGSGALNDRWMQFLSVYAGSIEDRQTKMFGEAYRTAVLADSPVSYWRLSESSGTTATDTQGAHNGTYTGGFTLGAAGRFPGNTAVTLNGSTGCVAIGTLNLANQSAFSYEAWIKYTTAGTAGTIFSETKTAAGNPYVGLFLGATEKLQIDQRNDAAGETTFDATSGSALNDGNYHHVVLTRSGSTFALYQDGASVGSTSLTQGSIATFNASTIGALRRTTNTEFFPGTIDEVAVYNTTLSSARVAAHFAAAT